MKFRNFFLFYLILLAGSAFSQNIAWNRLNGLGKGMNITNWLSSIHNPNGNVYEPYSEEDFAQISSLGFSHVRLPVGFHFWTDTKPPYPMDSTIFRYIDTAISWAKKYHLKVILDYHNYIETLWQDTLKTHTDRLCAIWKTISQRYASQNHDSLFYELYNEPGKVTKSGWVYAAKRMIDTIRVYDPARTIIVWLHASDPVAPNDFSDTNLIYTFHFYFPAEFTHQGSTWQAGGVRHTVNIPFPYDSLLMPPIDPGDIGTPHEAEYYQYPQTGTVDSLLHLLDRYKQYGISNNMPLYCGEYGTTVFAPVDSRIFWLNLVSKKLDSLHIPETHWGWKKSVFRIFNCSDCIDTDSIYKDSSGFSILCALQVDSCNPLTYIEPVNKSDFIAIYPNPSKGELYISTSKKDDLNNAFIEIYNINGYQLFQGKILSERISLHLASGMYFIKIYCANRSYVKKVIIN